MKIFLIVVLSIFALAIFNGLCRWAAFKIASYRIRKNYGNGDVAKYLIKEAAEKYLPRRRF
jgi:hypothetical protein